MHYCVGTYPLNTCKPLLTIEGLSFIDQIDGGQTTLELYLFESNENHSSLR